MRNKVNKILTVIALIPLTYFFLINLYLTYRLIIDFELKEIIMLISSIFGVLGYVGLVYNLFEKNLIKEKYNLLLLILGILGFILFNSFGMGGIKAWKWYLTVEELDEWLLIVPPIIITLYLICEKTKYIKSKN